ncbi:MAG: DUF2207 domain-containing protein [Micavibrio sp.]|nr:MAG: DUF2207 domain-containing protein [Micavibrio sp.]
MCGGEFSLSVIRNHISAVFDRRVFVALYALCFVLYFAAPAAAHNRPVVITDLAIDITVQPDSILTVVEKLAVTVAESFTPRRITLMYPTDIEHKWGLTYNTPIQIEAVLVNGENAPWSMRQGKTGSHLSIGHTEDEEFASGTYMLEIAYRRSYVITHTEEEDILRWIIGYPERRTNEDIMNQRPGYRGLPVENAVLRLHLPDGTPPPAITVTGDRIGYGRDNYRVETTPAGATVETLVPPVLRTLTVRAAWPAGHITPPEETYNPFAHKYPQLLGIAISFCFALYLFLLWLGFIKDHKDIPKDILLQKELPEKASTEEMAYVAGLGASPAHAIFSLAAKGYLHIEKKSGRYEYVLLRKKEADQTLRPGEAYLMAQLFPDGADKIEFSEECPFDMTYVRQYYERLLKAVYKEFYFTTDTMTYLGKALRGLFVVLAAYIILGLYNFPDISLFMAVFISSVSVIYGFLVSFPVLNENGLAAREIVFGYRAFLHARTVEEFKGMMPEEVTPEIFEKHLPYALTFGIAERLADRFRSNPLRYIYDDYRIPWYHDPQEPDALQAVRDLQKFFVYLIDTLMQHPEARWPHR